AVVILGEHANNATRLQRLRSGLRGGRPIVLNRRAGHGDAELPEKLFPGIHPVELFLRTLQEAGEKVDCRRVRDGHAGIAETIRQFSLQVSESLHGELLPTRSAATTTRSRSFLFFLFFLFFL